MADILLMSGNADDVGERLYKGLLDFGIMIEPSDLKNMISSSCLSQMCEEC